MRQPNRALLLAALCLAGGARARGQTSIGASWDGFSTYTCTAGTAFYCGQSFTVPAVSTVLQRFTYRIETGHTLSFELYPLSGLDIVGPALFTQSFGPTTGIQSLTFSPPGGLALTGGATYAALVFVDAGEQVVFLSNLSGPYAGGGILFWCQPGCETNPPAGDLVFTASFAPEPAPGGLLAAALLTLGAGAAAARRRRAAASGVPRAGR